MPIGQIKVHLASMQDWIASIVEGAASDKLAGSQLSVPDELRDCIISCRRFEAEGRYYERTAPSGAQIHIIIDGVWTFASPMEKVDVAPDEAVIIGPTDRATELSTGGGRLVTIELSAIGWLKLVSVPASVAANRIFLLKFGDGPDSDLRASSFEPQRSRQISFSIGSKNIAQQRNGARDTTVEYVAGALDADLLPTVEQLAAGAGVHSRTLYRYCIEAFGFGPMTLVKRQRLVRMIKNIRDLSPRKIVDIIPLDYYDQAHFNRDFKSVMGATPTEYRRRAQVAS